MIDSKNFLLLLLSFFIGSVLTVFFLDYDNISFTNTDWLTYYDSKSDFLALKFFLNDKWRFPIGLNPTYGDLTNSIVFSGAVPILSFIFKIFNNLLPNNFHFFSLWILICFSLQYFLAYKIINYLTKSISYSLISAIFFVISPILFYRLGIHFSLGAHWLILAALYLQIFKDQKFLLFKKSLLLTLSCLIHFYFTIILIIINLIISLEKFYFKKNFRVFIKENLYLFLPLIFTMYLVGYFVIPASDSLGFGYGFYKANLLTFFDPSTGGADKNWSLFLPDIYNSSGETEGYGYFGLGSLGLFLILISYVFLNYKKIIKKNLIYIFFSIFFLIIAFSNSVNFGNFEVFSFQLPVFLYAPLSIIRASGRLIWPVYYLILIFSLYSFHKFKFKAKYLFLILILQLIDLSPGINKIFLLKKPIDQKEFLDNRIWSIVSNNFRNIKSTSISNRSNDFNVISSLLIEEKFDKTNFFRLGRYNREEASIYRSELYKDLIEKNIDNDTAYIVDNFDHLRHLKYIFRDSAHGFFKSNGIWLILPGQRHLMTLDDKKNLEMINYKKIQLNRKISIKRNNIDGVLGIGWTHPSYGRTVKTAGAWTEGYSSNILFVSDKKIDSITIKIAKVIFKDQSLSNINFFLNNNKLTNIKLLKNKTIYLGLKNEKLKKDVNIITINIKKPVSPVSLLESVDGRLLGLLVNEVEFQ